MGKTVRRDWLWRKVQAGVVEAKCKYSYTDDYAHDAAHNFGKTDWIPARFSTGYGDFVDGQMNLRNSAFTSRSGGAWWNEDGTITLYLGFESYKLRIVDLDK